MIRTLFTSSSGLKAHQRFLDVVGNNLANVNTSGFKAQRVRFSDQFSETLRAHTLPNGALGGTNPIQVGNGVKVASTDTFFGQGSLEQTGNNLDLAMQGNGFFVVNNGQDDLYTRVGAFSIDSAKFLVDASTGYRVQRTGIIGEGTATAPGFQTAGEGSIRIPNGQTIPGRETTTINFQGNLNAAAVGPLAQTLRINQPLTAGGVAASAGTLLNSLDQTTTAFVDSDVIQITGTDINGKSINTQFVFDTASGNTTLGRLIDRINASYGTLSANGVVANVNTDKSPNGATASIDSQGGIVLQANRAGPSNLALNLSSTDTTALSGNLSFANFVEQVEGKNGDSATTAIEVFDEQGGAHTLTFTFEKKDANSWDLVSAIDPSGTFFTRDAFLQGITFNEDGSFQSITGGDAREVLATTSPLTINGVGGVAPATGATTINSLTQTAGAYAGGANDQIFIRGTDADGTVINTPFTVTAASTVTNLLTAINAAFGGATATLVSGNIVLTADQPGPAEVSLQLSSNTAGAAVTLFDDLTLAVNGTDGDDTIDFEVTSLAAFATPQSISLSLGNANDFNGLTQFGGFTSVSARSQDGFKPGSLVSVAVSTDGVVNGSFSNGQTVAIAQLAIATFANEDSLDRVAENYFSDNGNSGPAIVSAALTNGAGSVQNSVLEASNVDISFEFTQLITAQRGFQVNARAFSAADRVLEESVNLVR